MRENRLDSIRISFFIFLPDLVRFGLIERIPLWDSGGRVPNDSELFIRRLIILNLFPLVFKGNFILKKRRLENQKTHRGSCQTSNFLTGAAGTK